MHQSLDSSKTYKELSESVGKKFGAIFLFKKQSTLLKGLIIIPFLKITPHYTDYKNLRTFVRHFIQNTCDSSFINTYFSNLTWQ